MASFIHTSSFFAASPSRHQSSTCAHRIARDSRQIPLKCVADINTTKPIHLKSAFKTISETPHPIQLTFTNPIPQYLSEYTYYLNGPAIFEVLHRDGILWEANHFFDAIGIVHAFRFDSTLTVHYRSSSNNRSLLDTIRATKAADFIQAIIARRPQLSFIKSLFLMRPFTPNPTTGSVPFNNSVSLQTIPGKGLLNARTDVNNNQLLDPITLRPLQTYTFADLHPDLSGDISCAHGLTDRQTGTYFNFVYRITGLKADYKVFTIDREGQTRILAAFKDYPTYIHSFALTQNYVIMLLCPARYDLLKLITTKSISSSITFPQHAPTKFVVISRKHAKVVATYEYHQFFTFHVINAFEQDDAINIDVSYYDDPSIIRQLQTDNITSGGEITGAKPVRFTLPDLSRGMAIGKTEGLRAKKSSLAEVEIELTTIAPRCETKPYTYMYGISDNACGEFRGDVAKLDITSGAVVRWRSPGMLTNEPMFVPDPNGNDEDDGCILMVTLSPETETSSLIVLDAKNMKEIARATLLSPIPPAFHGTILSVPLEQEQTRTM